MTPALQSRVAELPAHTVIFNSYALGGWILFADPQLNPVIDGRADVYTLDHLRRYVEATKARPGWQTTVRGSGATVALLEADSPLAQALRDQLGWTVAAHDTGYVLLRPPGA
jgi:hypothetical protein